MKKIKLSKKIIGAIIAFCTLLVIYLGTSIYFTNHFYFGTKINGMNISGKTVDDVNQQMLSKIDSYTLELQERNDAKEQISAKDIDLKDDSESKLKELKDSQNPFNWLFGALGKKDSSIEQTATYDEALLKKAINNLNCLKSNNVVEPKDASIEYKNNSYVINKEVMGNKVIQDTLQESITNAISKRETTLDLEAINCYVNPKYTEASKEVIDAKSTLDKYIASKVTYTLGNNSETVDGATIQKWLSVDENFVVTIDEDKVQTYVNKLSANYSTVGKTREFVTSLGTKATVSGGDYGWAINKVEEKNSILSAIKDGQTITKEPTYSQKAASHEANDIGNTYVEVNMTKQHLWFYKNGSLITDGDIVTGNIAGNTGTPTGVYTLKYKEKDFTLRGPQADGTMYESPVKFWMPFNGGIGIHDASWRYDATTGLPIFGGQIYQTNGSHGCVNAPTDLANKIFDNIDNGTPIICFY